MHQGRRPRLVHAAQGSLGGNYIKYQGMVNGTPKVETHLEWQMTPHTDPSWDIKGCYITQIKGDPCIYNKHMIFPKPGVDLSNPDNFASIAMTFTGLPPQRHRIRGGRTSWSDHQRRPSAARVRRTLQVRTCRPSGRRPRLMKRTGSISRISRAAAPNDDSKTAFMPTGFVRNCGDFPARRLGLPPLAQNAGRRQSAPDPR